MYMYMYMYIYIYIYTHTHTGGGGSGGPSPREICTFGDLHFRRFALSYRKATTILLNNIINVINILLYSFYYILLNKYYCSYY